MNKKYYWNLLTFMMVAMLSSFGFASCDSDNISTPIENSDFVGTWEFTQSTDYLDSGTKEGALVGKAISFTDNGTYSSNTSTFYYGNYSVSANELTLRSNKGKKFTAKVSNKKTSSMVLKGQASDGYSFTYAIKKKY
jgi:hypothetical protein